MSQSISADFPFQSKFIDVKGSKMHYVDEGTGEIVLFLHGNPTSSYLWRNIIPYVSSGARCIAPDLIGMGKSDKPNISYDYETQYSYLEAFINKLELKNITLVLHDWGSGLGFHYARLNESNVKAIAFMEAMIKPLRYKEMPSFGLQMAFRMMRTPVLGWIMLSVGNMFIKKMLPGLIVRKLNKKEFDYYKEPYQTIATRKAIRQWPIEVPINGRPKFSYDNIKAYGEWLKRTDLPKLFFYANPGAIIREDDVNYIKTNFSNIKSVDIGEGLHFVQEDNPHLIGRELMLWLVSLNNN